MPTDAHLDTPLGRTLGEAVADAAGEAVAPTGATSLVGKAWTARRRSQVRRRRSRAIATHASRKRPTGSVHLPRPWLPMLLSENERREKSQVDAVVRALRPLGARAEQAVRLAIAFHAIELERDFPAETAALAPEELTLLAAHRAATLATPRGFFAYALRLSTAEGDAFCARLEAKVGALAADRGWGSVRDRAKALDAAPRPERT